MELRWAWDRPARPASPAPLTACLMVGVTVEDAPSVGHDVCVLVDASRSMEGAKIERAREACRQAAGSLGPEDRLAICAFATRSAVVVPLTPSAALRPEEIDSALARIRPGGCTLTLPALERVRDLLAHGDGELRPATVLLITDGHPTDDQGGPLADLSPLLATADAFTAAGIALTPVGLGSGDDFNTSVLESLADRGRGTFCHAERPEDLGALLSARFARARSVSHAAATLDVEALDPGVRVEAACRVAPECAELSVQAPDGGVTPIALGPLESGHEVVFLLRICTSGRFGVEGSRAVLRAHLRAGQETGSLEANLLFTGAPREQQRVDAEANRYRLAWELARYQALANASSDPGRTGDLLERIRTTGELIGSPAVVASAEGRLRELRETGALSGNANARATAMLRATGELLATLGLEAPQGTGEVMMMAERRDGGVGFGGGSAPRAEDSQAVPVPLEQSSARLAVRRGREIGRTYSLSRAETTIGRAAPSVTVDIDLTDQEPGDRYTVSRRHAVISWEDGRCLLRDLGSTAGTIVNGAPVPALAAGRPGEAVELQIGDRLLLGAVELEVTADASA